MKNSWRIGSAVIFIILLGLVVFRMSDTSVINEISSGEITYSMETIKQIVLAVNVICLIPSVILLVGAFILSNINKVPKYIPIVLYGLALIFILIPFVRLDSKIVMTGIKDDIILRADTEFLAMRIEEQGGNVFTYPENLFDVIN